jgi:plasmid maintenance system antidote protein VapI
MDGGENMVILVREKLDGYLQAIGRDQSWLAKKFGVTKGYISQVVNNKCKIPLVMIERLLILTDMRFENLFYFDGKYDGREFFGARVWHEAMMMDNEIYKKTLDKNKHS